MSVWKIYHLIAGKFKKKEEDIRIMFVILQFTVSAEVVVRSSVLSC